MTAVALAPGVGWRRISAAVAVSALCLAATPALATGAGSVVERGTSWGFGAGAASTEAKIDPAVYAVKGATASVIVTATAGRVDEAARVAAVLGGTVGERLPLVDGFTVRASADQLEAIAASGAVAGVTLDRDVQFEEMEYDAESTASNFARTSGATAAWSQGMFGSGVGVAVIDTGVSQMNDFSGRVVHGPDLSGEGTVVDSYGHGTVMAGIIGGSGADSSGREDGAYTGVAPEATLVAVKAAGRNGVTDVSTMLQAMHWVSAYKDQFNIRVLNLSWGTPSTQSPALDPINYAVQRLWKQGIVVVVAAGNSGPVAGTITKPGDDPLVITAGAFDDKGDGRTDNDGIPDWSSRGPTAQGLVKPDVIAPGRTLVAARSFGSAVEAGNPKALLAPSYIKGSGTSQAAAVTSGAAALLLQARPELTPDQVKAVLKGSAVPMNGKLATEQGSGRINLGAALKADPGPAVQQTATATGLGSLELSRGGRNVQTDCGKDGTTDLIVGEVDARCEGWNGSAWTGSAWTGSAWTGSAWTGSAWTGSAWTGSAWTGSAWTGSAWTGGQWTGSAWTGSAWTGSAWTGSAWTGSAWTGSAWTGSAWTGSAWTGSAWTSALYGDAPVAGAGFLTGFFGNQPKYYQRVAGETSEKAPRGCNLRNAGRGHCK